MSYEDLLLEKKDSIATITLNVPRKLNAFSPAMRASLVLAVDEIADDNDVRVVIVTGAGRGFCSGEDVSRLQMDIDADASAPISRRERLAVVGEDIACVFPQLNKPVIAAINGPCVGAGFSVALSADIRIASDKAKFGVAQISRALVPDLGMTHFLPAMVGTSLAFELMITGELIDAAEAERLGIVRRVVSHDELMPTVRSLATKIACQAPLAVELTKKILLRKLLEDAGRQLDLETYALDICRQTEDHRNAVLTFLEKQPPPQFKGR